MDRLAMPPMASCQIVLAFERAGQSRQGTIGKLCTECDSGVVVAHDDGVAAEPQAGVLTEVEDLEVPADLGAGEGSIATRRSVSSGRSARPLAGTGNAVYDQVDQP